MVSILGTSAASSSEQGLSSSPLSCSGGISDQPCLHSPSSPFQQEQLCIALPLFKGQPIAKVVSAVTHFPGFILPGDMVSRITPRVIDVLALLPHREMFCFAMQERSLFCIILAGAHHCRCTMKVIFFSWAPCLLLNEISSATLFQVFNIMRAFCNT